MIVLIEINRYFKLDSCILYTKEVIWAVRSSAYLLGKQISIFKKNIVEIESNIIQKIIINYKSATRLKVGI